MFESVIQYLNHLIDLLIPCPKYYYISVDDNIDYDLYSEQFVV